MHVQACGAQGVGLGAELERAPLARAQHTGFCSDWNKYLLELYTLPIFMWRTGGRRRVN